MRIEWDEFVTCLVGCQCSLRVLTMSSGRVLEAWLYGVLTEWGRLVPSAPRGPGPGGGMETRKSPCRLSGCACLSLLCCAGSDSARVPEPCLPSQHPSPCTLHTPAATSATAGPGLPGAGVGGDGRKWEICAQRGSSLYQVYSTKFISKLTASMRTEEQSALGLGQFPGVCVRVGARVCVCVRVCVAVIYLWDFIL